MRQEDLADRCGLFRTYMSRIETGKANPTLTMIHALAVSLGVKPGELLEVPAKSIPVRVKRASAPASRGRVSR
jgi:transcriptional regulator with XRE-family HTH domain